MKKQILRSRSVREAARTTAQDDTEGEVISKRAQVRTVQEDIEVRA